MSKEVRDLVRQEGLWQGEPEIRVLNGGYWNKVFRVTTGARRFVVKQFTTTATGTLFPNLPHDEAKALQRLGGLRVAPELIGFWPNRSMLAYDYVEGTHWDGDLTGMADVLIRKEQADGSGFRKVPTEPAEILAEGDRFFERCAGGPPQSHPTIPLVSPPARLSLIHTDLGAANLIGAGAGLRIIDWQCPAEGDLCEDLYSFLSPAFQILSLRKPLSEADGDAFLSALSMPAVVARYRSLRPSFAWRMAGYCCWRSETAEEADVRARYKAAARAELQTLGALS